MYEKLEKSDGTDHGCRNGGIPRGVRRIFLVVDNRGGEDNSGSSGHNGGRGGRYEGSGCIRGRL